MKRRDFLRTAGVAGGATAAAAATPAAAQEGTTHTVDMTDGLVFDPDSITISPGDTVEWVNTGTIGHSVTAYEDNIPDEATYFASGGFESEDDARGAYPEGDIPGGESYSHTFEVEGTYEYMCIPHESAGMVGTVQVGESAGGGGGGGGGEGGGGGGGEIDPEHIGVPFQAHYVGLATILMIIVSLVFTFYTLKYGESPHASGGNR